MIEIAMYADRAENGVRFASRAMDVEPAADQAVDDLLDLRVGRAFLHYDDHWLSASLSIRRWRPNGTDTNNSEP
jgi:hypothetical protein